MTDSTNCRVCGSGIIKLFDGELLGHSVEYQECKVCGFVQTENPHWLNEAYEDAINNSDTGILARNTNNLEIVIATLFSLGRLKHRVVDFAGGYGILVRLLRDRGIDAWFSDPYCENLVARGFEDNGSEAFLVTAFEAFEHFEHPPAEFEKMLATAPNILLSTTFIPDPAPPFETWWYYGKEHGQHISLYRKSTFQYLAKKHGKHFVSANGRYHLFSERPVGKLRWIATLIFRKILTITAGLSLRSKTWDDHLANAEPQSPKRKP